MSFRLTNGVSLFTGLINRMVLQGVKGMPLDQLSGEVTIKSELTRIAEYLWQEVPAGAQGLVLIVYVPKMFVPAIGYVRLSNGIDLPVRFDPSSDVHPDGTVVIGYGWGKFESAIR